MRLANRKVILFLVLMERGLGKTLLLSAFSTIDTYRRERERERAKEREQAEERARARARTRARERERRESSGGRQQTVVGVFHLSKLK